MRLLNVFLLLIGIGIIEAKVTYSPQVKSRKSSTSSSNKKLMRSVSVEKQLQKKSVQKIPVAEVPKKTSYFKRWLKKRPTVAIPTSNAKKRSNSSAKAGAKSVVPVGASSSLKPPSVNAFFPVRVLLDEKLSRGARWSMRSDNGIIMSSLTGGRRKEWNVRSLSITASTSHITINGSQFKARALRLSPRSGVFKLGDVSYAGELIIFADKDKVYCINELDIEEYLFSVLRWEGWPGWPLEVNKVFAVMCRTYVINKVVRARKKKKSSLPYDIKATNFHQTYKGLHDVHALREAVKSTQGMILAHNKKPIVAMYDSCCGGVIPAHCSEVNFKEAPYLARDYACTFCRSSSLYKWKKEYALSDVEDIFRTAGSHHLLPVSDIVVSRADKAKLVHEVKVRTNSSWFTLTGKKIYSLFKDIKSLCFTLQKSGKKVICTGYGFGHHLGVCQWGARQMVREGWDYKSILHFYYTGVTLMRYKVNHGQL